MSVREFLFNQYITIQAKMIDKRLVGIDWEKDYGLTPQRMEEIRQRIYERLMDQIRIYEAVNRKDISTERICWYVLFFCLCNYIPLSFRKI